MTRCRASVARCLRCAWLMMCRVPRVAHLVQALLGWYGGSAILRSRWAWRAADSGVLRGELSQGVPLLLCEGYHAYAQHNRIQPVRSRETQTETRPEVRFWPQAASSDENPFPDKKTEGNVNSPSQRNTGASSWWLVHLSEHQGDLGITIELNDTSLLHFVVQIVTLASSLTDAGEDRVTTVCLGDVVL